MRVLLTGASGFIGRSTLVALLELGAHVLAVSRSRPQCSGDFDWIPLDFQDSATSSSLLARLSFDAVLHLAWNVEHGRFWTAEDNLDWLARSLMLARAAKDLGVKRFVGVGTCFEYDCYSDSDCIETVTPINPRNLYAVSKDSARRLLECYFDQHDISMAWARPFFMYGPGEGPHRLVPSICRALAAKQVARCSSGKVVRDFMDVRDVGRALAALLQSDVRGAVNIGSGEAISVADIAKRIGTISGSAHLIALGALPDRDGEPPRITADITRLRTEVGFYADRTLDQGLRDSFQLWKYS